MGLHRKKQAKEENREKAPVESKRVGRHRLNSNKQLKKKRLRRVALIFLLLFIVAIGYFGLKAYLAVKDIFATGTGTQGELFGLLRGNPSQPLKGQDRDRINVLFYGMTKDEARTDSIILASYYWHEKKLVTLNIPRDLYFYDGHENAKLAEIYSYALKRQPDNQDYPSEFVASVISKEYAVPIDYWVKFDMQGEVDLINAIGGIDINAPNSFTDHEYPNWDYTGYIRPAPHFKAGLQHMDGKTALIYSRSRHSLDNNEGTDFARSKRQALVIQATMQKIKSMGIIGNVADISNYLNILGKNVHTNMTLAEMVSFAKVLKDLDPKLDYLKASWETGNGFLCDATNSEGAYIIKYGLSESHATIAGGSRDSKYKDMARYFIENLLTVAPIEEEKASVAVYNGTLNAGLATRVAEEMKKEGYNVTLTGAATTKDHEKTTIIDYTDGKKPKTIKILESKFGVSAVKQTSDNAPEDIKVIVGQDYLN